MKCETTYPDDYSGLLSNVKWYKKNSLDTVLPGYRYLNLFLNYAGQVHSKVCSTDEEISLHLNVTIRMSKIHIAT